MYITNIIKIRISVSCFVQKLSVFIIMGINNCKMEAKL